MNNKVVTTISIIAVLGILAVNINSNAFAQNTTDIAPDDQPISSGTDCHYLHGNTGVLSPCNPTPGNPPIAGW
jgi:hypothetical protein